MNILCSGGFDPLHIGHTRMIDAASFYGDVVIALNSDNWLRHKKGYVFMPWAARSEILLGLTEVRVVYEFDDTDGTVCDALRRYRPKWFCNGGDRTKPNLAEHAICEELGIKELFDVGGDKVASSSEIVKRSVNQMIYYGKV